MNIEQAIDILKNSIADYVIGEYCEKCVDNKICDDRNEDCYYQQAIDIVVTAYEKQSKEIEELKEKNKELYEIKYIASRFINRSMKQFSIGEFKYKVNNFIEWEDKIKAKIEELDLAIFKNQTIYTVNKMQEIKFARLCLAELLEEKE